MFTPLSISFCFLFSSLSSLFPFYTPYLRSLKLPPLFQASPVFPLFSLLFKNFPPVLTIFPSLVSRSKQKLPLSFILLFFYASVESSIYKAISAVVRGEQGSGLLSRMGRRGSRVRSPMGAWGFRFWGQHAERERLNCFGFYFILFYLLGTQKWVTTKSDDNNE